MFKLCNCSGCRMVTRELASQPIRTFRCVYADHLSLEASGEARACG